ncbi:MAG: hypothetical protein GW854_06835 [Erythrobacter sp.]|nr:hypothetical protein [Erythrobacter sp.]
MLDKSNTHFLSIPILGGLALFLAACNGEAPNQSTDESSVVSDEGITALETENNNEVQSAAGLEPADEILPEEPKTPAGGKLARPGEPVGPAVRSNPPTKPASSPSSRPIPTAKASPDTEPMDDHSGHDMNDMSDHDMSGM